MVAFKKRPTGFGALRGFRRLCADLSRAACFPKAQGYLYPAPRLAVQRKDANMPETLARKPYIANQKPLGKQCLQNDNKLPERTVLYFKARFQKHHPHF